MDIKNIRIRWKNWHWVPKSKQKEKQGKERENHSLKQEVNKRQTDLSKKNVSIMRKTAGLMLVKKEEVVKPKECKYNDYGVNTFPRHKIESAAACILHGLTKEAKEIVIDEYK